MTNGELMGRLIIGTAIIGFAGSWLIERLALKKMRKLNEEIKRDKEVLEFMCSQHRLRPLAESKAERINKKIDELNKMLREPTMLDAFELIGRQVLKLFGIQ